ncbi:MAG: class I SAM-dependent RNA methyltransferase [Eubacteriales bacterium]
MKIKLTATCLFGLERLLGEEIDALGYDRAGSMDGRVSFYGDEEAVAYANVFLRYAERVYIQLGEFEAATFDQLFEGTKALPWEMWIGKNDAFPVKGHSVQSALFSVPDCQKIIKRAMADRLGAHYGLRWLEESGVKYQVVFFLFKDRAALMIDTSGEPLYKRGYRTEAGEAPLRETLAAALAAYSRPREEVLFWDPMCGSGTIAIEAAMLYNQIAPGQHRSFAAEAFAAVPASLWAQAREEAAEVRLESGFEVYASDSSEASVALTAANCRRAGVSDSVRAFVADARTIGAPGRRGTIVTNPPYGERMGTPEQAEQLYREIGRHFQSLAPWQVYIITSHRDFERLYGKRADKVRKLYNGMIPCYFYQYFKNPSPSRR